MSRAYRCNLISGSSSKLLRERNRQLEAGTEDLGTAESDPENTARRVTRKGITVVFIIA